MQYKWVCESPYQIKGTEVWNIQFHRTMAMWLDRKCQIYKYTIRYTSTQSDIQVRLWHWIHIFGIFIFFCNLCGIA